VHEPCPQRRARHSIGVESGALPLPIVGRVLKGFRAGLNTAPEHADGSQTWAQYVAALGDVAAFDGAHPGRDHGQGVERE
jgi:hypothetical protein